MQLWYYSAAIVCLLFHKSIFSSKFAMFVIFSSIWVPQIIKNSLNASRGKSVPDIGFATVYSFHVAFIPLYFSLVDNNFMMLKYDFNYGCFTLVWICY